MFALQLQYEWKHLLRSPVSWLLILFLGAAMAFGAYNGRKHVTHRQASIAELQQAQAEKFTALATEADSIIKGLKKTDRWWLDPTNPLAIGALRRGGGTLVLKPTPEQALATGMSDLQPEAFILRIGEQHPHNSSDYDNPARLALGAFDLAFVIVYLLPLFVIAFTYNLLSGEREQGTLALLLSQPVEARQVFVFKLVARFVWLSLLIAVLWWPAAAWAGIPASVTAQALGVALLYNLFWFLLSLAINLTWQQGSAFNALAGIGAWLMLVVIMPAVVNMLAEKARPVPSRASYENDLRELDNQLEKERPALLDAYYAANPQLERKPDEEKTSRDLWLESFYIGDILKERASRVKAEYNEKVQHHADLVRQLMLLSPALAVYDRLTALAGTNRATQLAIQTQLEAKEHKWSEWFKSRYIANQPLSSADYPVIQAMVAPLEQKPAAYDHRGLLWLCVHLVLAVLPMALLRRQAAVLI